MGGAAPPPSPKFALFLARPPHGHPHLSKGWACAQAPHAKISKGPPHKNIEAPPQAPPPIDGKFTNLITHRRSIFEGARIIINGEITG